MKLGKRILLWRKHYGLSQSEVAERIGISPEAVSQWEHDVTSPTTENLQGFAGALGLPMERFYGELPKRKRAA